MVYFHEAMESLRDKTSGAICQRRKRKSLTGFASGLLSLVVSFGSNYVSCQELAEGLENYHVLQRAVDELEPRLESPQIAIGFGSLISR